MDDLEKDRQVGCGEEQDLKRVKLVVLAVARMVRSHLGYWSFFLAYQKTSQNYYYVWNIPSGAAEFRAFCLAANGESRWCLLLWLTMTAFTVYILSFLFSDYMSLWPFFLFFGHLIFITSSHVVTEVGKVRLLQLAWWVLIFQIIFYGGK